MKKILAILLMLSLAFTLVSCVFGSGDNSGNTDGGNTDGGNTDGGNTDSGNTGGSTGGTSDGNLGGGDDAGKEGPIIPWDTENFEIVG